MAVSRSLVASLLIALFLIGFSRARIEKKFPWPYPALTELQPSEHLAQDLGTVATGSHRLAADLAYIQFLQAYGETEDDDDREIIAHASKAHAEVFPNGERILRLDPFFRSAILEISATLAFNLKRPDEALQLLNDATRRDPGYIRYRLYVGAILYKNQGADRSLIRLLEEDLEEPEVQPILQSVLAGLYKKYGEFDKAARVYLRMIATDPVPLDRETAQKRLMRLLGEHPELRPMVQQELERAAK